MQSAIHIESVSKLYRIGRRPSGAGSLREEVTQWFRRLVRGDAATSSRLPNNLEPTDPTAPAGHFWALRDVDLAFDEGEVIGVVGRNGAGKSTLLKILARITPPTLGRIRYRGRVGSLLEIGTGFHRELTGRENIFLNGSILGMTREQVTAKLDEIVAFAEIDQFLDTPVKFYSSGMYVRLAFAVAAHLDTDILLVDEVLAVGDVRFQRKCLGKIQNVATAEGRTVLFVSHNMNAVQRLCSQGLFLEDGRTAGKGSAAQIVTQYLSALSSQNAASGMSID